MARVRYLDAADLPDDVRWLYDRLAAGSGSVGNIFRALAHHPQGLRGFMILGTALLQRASLDPRLRELAIVRAGQICGADYEVVHHVAIARSVGLGEEQLAHLADWNAHPDLYAPAERAVIRYAEAVTRDVAVPDDLYGEVRAFLGEREVVELTLTVGYYNMVARFLVALKIDLEPDAASH